MKSFLLTAFAMLCLTMCASALSAQCEGCGCPAKAEKKADAAVSCPEAEAKAAVKAEPKAEAKVEKKAAASECCPEGICPEGCCPEATVSRKEAAKAASARASAIVAEAEAEVAQIAAAIVMAAPRSECDNGCASRCEATASAVKGEGKARAGACGKDCTGGECQGCGACKEAAAKAKPAEKTNETAGGGEGCGGCAKTKEATRAVEKKATN